MSNAKLSSRVAMYEAVGAYIRCEKLSLEVRRRLIKLARVRVSLFEAIKITFSFAHGYIDAWSRKGIRTLTRAWLRLGELLFQKIYRWVKPRNCEASGELKDLVATVLPRSAVA